MKIKSIIETELQPPGSMTIEMCLRVVIEKSKLFIPFLRILWAGYWLYQDKKFFLVFITNADNTRISNFRSGNKTAFPEKMDNILKID